MFIRPAGTEMTNELLNELIKEHRDLIPRLQELEKLYVGKHPILEAAEKEQYKPDNRLVVNFAKYIVDTFAGFFAGIPVKLMSDDDGVAEYIAKLAAYNSLDDSVAELAKMTSIYGYAYELIYVDEIAEVGITPFSPMDGFVVYDDTITRNPLFGVHYHKLEDGSLKGTWSDNSTIYWFTVNGAEVTITDENPHMFGGVPIVEYVENSERIGAYETVETLIKAYSKALSEKANDVDYYADAYLKILGAPIEEGGIQAIRDNRIINLPGEDTSRLIVEFLSKPDADGTQEHLLEHIEEQIYRMSMVANIGDSDFGNASGISLAYKLQGMSNLAITKERKFTAAMQRRFELISNVPISGIPADEWMSITFAWTRNVPKNLLEESQIAGNLTGIESKESILSVLSNIDDPRAELERIEAENAPAELPPRIALPEETEQPFDSVGGG